jgi:polyhydroxyalkanoate synthase
MVEEVYRVPILMVMATTNRGYIFDLAPGQSMVEFLLQRGHDVYVLDWAPPKPEEKNLKFEDYVLDFVPDAIRHVQQDSGEEHVNLVGYCFGGVLSLMYLSLHADGPVKNFVAFTTPVDFKQMTLFQRWSDPKYFDVDRLVDNLGNVPPDVIVTSFEMLRPASKTIGQIQLWENMWNDEYVNNFRRFERWTADTLPLAGEYFRQTTKELMWKNGLYTGELTVGGRKVDMGQIRLPVMHAVGLHDHIVPYEAAKHLVALVSSEDKEEVILKGGHVSLIAGPNAKKRLWPKLDSWLGERSI